MCVFCEEGFDFSRARDFLGNQWPYPNRVVFYDQFLFAVVGYGPQVCPYILIIPYRHIYSISEMNLDERESLKKCLAFLCGRGGYSQQICIFEHGGATESGSSSIDHCHIHVIDGKWRLYDYINMKKCLSIHNLEDLTDMSNSYLLVGEYHMGNLSLKLIDDNHHEHQFFRKVLAKIIGDEQWNWKENMRYDRMLRIMRAFKNVKPKD